MATLGMKLSMICRILNISGAKGRQRWELEIERAQYVAWHHWLYNFVRNHAFARSGRTYLYRWGYALLFGAYILSGQAVRASSQTPDPTYNERLFPSYGAYDGNFCRSEAMEWRAASGFFSSVVSIRFWFQKTWSW
jgi:hypothetical protein